MRTSINKTLSFAAILIMLSVAVIAYISLLQSKQVTHSSKSVSHTEQVLLLIQKIIATALDNETGARGYVLVGKEKFLTPLQQSEKSFTAELNLLQLLLKDNSLQLQRLDSLRFYINKRVAFSKRMIKTRDESGMQAAAALVASEEGKNYTDKIRSIGIEMKEAEAITLLQKKAKSDTSLRMLNIILYAILLLIVSAGLYFIYYIKSNIDHRKKVQTKLELLTRQIEDAHDAIIMVNDKLKITSWNHGAEKLYGFTRAEALGKNSTELLQTDISNEEINSTLEIIHEKDYWTGELSRTRKNGEVIYVRSSTTTIRDSKGHVTGYVSVSYDITKQKELSIEVDHLATLVEHSSDAIISKGLDQRIISWNEGAEQLFGYSKEEAIGKTAAELELFKISEDQQASFEKTSTANGSGQAEIEYFHKNKTSFIGSATFNAIKNEQGETTSYAIIIRDISVAKTTAELLKKSNEELEQKVKERTDAIVKTELQLRNTLDNMLEGAQLIGFDMVYIYVNNTASKQGKYTKEQMIGKPVLELYPGFDQTELYKHFQRCLNERVAIQLEQEFEFPDKTKNWFELSLQPVPEGIFILSVDITDRRQAEAKRTLFTSIINSSDDAIFSKSLDGIITSWNHAAEIIFGYTADEIIGKNIRSLLPVHLLPEENEMIRKIKEGEAVHHFETQRLRKDGSLITISLSASPLRDEYAAITGVSAIARDITQENEIKNRIIQSEENLKTIFDNTSEGFVLLDTHAIVKAFNKTAEDNILLNMDMKLVLGKSIFNFIEPVRELFFTSVIERVLQGEKIQYDRAHVIENSNTSWIDYTFTPVYKSNTITGICITGRDITEKKIAEENIRISNERYEAVAKATSDAIWDYDFNTGKTFISGTGYKFLFGYPVVNDYSEEGYWESHIHPDDKKRVLNELANTLADRNKVQSASEYRFLKADGTYAYLNDRFFIIRENGSPKRMLGAKQDITEKKIAEEQLKASFLEKQALAERLSTIINTLPANIALLDSNGIVVAVNDAWKNFADSNGFIGNNYGVGDNYIDISERSSTADTHDGMIVSLGLQSVLSGKEKEFMFEYSCHTPNENRWFKMMTAPLKEKDYSGAVVMHIDISELKRFEQERLQMEKDEQKKITKAMLQGQEKERNAIGEELHDNVNQILVSSSLMLSMVKGKQGNSDEMISHAMTQIQNAINENRKIAHLFVAPNLQTKSLSDQLHQLSENMIEVAGMKAIFHFTQFDEDRLNSEQKINIYRIAQEQFTNIVKYSKATTVDITIHTTKELFSMTIADNGVGTKSYKKMNGIGLRNIHGRLGLFNGKASVETTPGNGFVLKISFPL